MWSYQWLGVVGLNQRLHVHNQPSTYDRCGYCKRHLRIYDAALAFARANRDARPAAFPAALCPPHLHPEHSHPHHDHTYPAHDP